MLLEEGGRFINEGGKGRHIGGINFGDGRKWGETFGCGPYNILTRV